MLDELKIRSPRLALLAAELAEGKSNALESFWQELVQRDTPLIEPIATDSANMWVTFVWRGSNLKNVVLLSYLLWGGDTFALKALSRLPDTDLWYLTVKLPNDARAIYFFSPDDPFTPLSGESATAWELRQANFRPDPLNSRRFVYPADKDDYASKEESISILELPQAQPDSWHIKQAEIPAGKVAQFNFVSNILNNSRRLRVYTPPNYKQTQKYPLLLLFDGWACLNLMSIPTILDNLIAAEQLPPVVAVFLDSSDAESRNRELPCYAPFVESLTCEVLPWVRQRFVVSEDPCDNLVGDISYGGLAAVYAAFQPPEIWGSVLSQSGSF